MKEVFVQKKGGWISSDRLQVQKLLAGRVRNDV